MKISLQVHKVKNLPSFMEPPETLFWEVYIILTKSGKLYTGITKDLSRRFLEHKTSKGARFFHFSSPKKIVFREVHKTRSSATKRELAIKSLNKAQKLSLIQSYESHGQNHSSENRC